MTAERRWFAEMALLPGGLARHVLLTARDGRWVEVASDADPGDAERVKGLVVPGLANCHSHAFHRALRGRTHADGGTFWTWREAMYAVAARLDPDRYLTLARAAYAEMALAGVTSVGEFHYLHHGPDGRPYANPNAMGEALRQAAREAGVRLTLLDTCYLTGALDAGGHRPLEGVQRRFGDGDVQRWADRVAAMTDDEGFRVGAAIHSVRAVPRDQLAEVRAAVHDRGPDVVTHAHVSEQPAENDACVAVYGRTPVGLLHDAGLVDGRFSAVHATHLTDDDVRTLGTSRATACFCPTTERDLADGIGPARALLDAGARLSLGSDQHAVVDLLEEARALEMHERLSSLKRGRLDPADLLTAATAHASIQWDDAGRLEVGQRADLVALDTCSPRTAGAAPEQLLLAATASDVRTVVRDGEVVVSDGQHVLGDVGRLLSEAVEPLWRDA